MAREQWILYYLSILKKYVRWMKLNIMEVGGYLALGMYIYILASGSNEVLPIIQQICDSSVGQGVRTIIPDATATCQKINIEAQASLIGIELGYTLMIIGPVVSVAGGLTTKRKYYRRDNKDWI
jgi:hypothetical protein